MKGVKRYLSLFLSLAMLIAYTPAFVFAGTETADAEVTEQVLDTAEEQAAEETAPAATEEAVPEEEPQEDVVEDSAEETPVKGEKAVLRGAAKGASMSYTCAEPLVFTEGISEGWTTYDDDDNEYYYFDLSSEDIFRTGDVLTLNGVKYTYDGDSFADSEGNVIDLDELSWSDNQYDSHWTPGTKNAKITLSYWSEADEENISCDIYVSINALKISFEFAEPLNLIENADGDTCYEQIYDETSDEWEEVTYFRYDIPSVYTEGNKLTVNDVVYTCNDDDEYVSPDGDIIEAWDIDISDNQSYKNQWSRTNPGKITVEYRNKSFVIDAVIHENPIKTIKFEFKEPLEFIEGCNGYDNGDYFYYYTPGTWSTGNTLTINGTDVYTSRYDDETGDMVYRNSEGKKIDADDIDMFTDQSSENPWTLTNKGHITVRYQGREYVIEVTVQPNPVKTVSFEFKEPVVLLEGIDGYESSYGEYDYETGETVEKKYFRYYYPNIYNSGNKLTVNGEVYTFKYDKKLGKRVFRNADGSKTLNEKYLDYSDNQSYENQWSTSNPGKLTVTYMGHTCEATVTIQKNPVTSISFEPAEPFEVYEKASGYMYEDEIYDEETGGEKDVTYFRYYEPSIYKQGSKLIVNGKAYTYDAEARAFINGSDKIDRYDVDAYSDQSYSNQWSKSNPGKITIKYMNNECTLQVKVVDNPVKNIEFKLAEPVSITEYTRGYMCNDSIKQADGSYTDVKYFYYYTPSVFREGSKLIVDGVEYTYRYNDEHPAYVSENEDVIFIDDAEGYPDIERTTDQSAENPWTPSNPGHITITYMGREAVVPVTINKSNVTSVSYEPVEPLTVYENWDGYWEDDDDDGDGYFRYEEPFRVRAGDKLIVNGTVYTCERYAFPEGDGYYYGYNFVSADGQTIDRDEIDYTDNQSYENQWSKTNPGKVTLSYGGKSTELTVNVINWPIDSITFQQASVPRIMENTHGYYDEDSYDEDYYHYEFPGFSAGDKLTVNYNDGRGSVTYTAKDVTDDGYTYLGFVSPDGKDVIDTEMFDWDSDQYDDPWGVGDHEFTINYLDKKAKFKVTIYESDVAAISFAGTEPVTVYEGYGNEEESVDDEKYFDYSLVEVYHAGDKLTVTHKNGTKTVYTYKQIGTNGRYAFLDANGNEIADTPDIFEDQYFEPWKPGANNTMTLNCFGLTAEVPVVIKENPVASITPALTHPVIVKSENAAYRRDLYGKIYKHYYISRYYSSGSESLFLVDGDKVVVKFKDGTQKTFTYSVKANWFLDENGKYADLLEYEENQYKEHWVKGGANPIYMTYLGVKSTPLRAMIDEVIEVKSIADATVTQAGKAEYNGGEPVEASFDVVLGGRNLVEGYDYTVSYENNVNIGTGIATLHGINSFDGTKRVEFTISPKAVTPVVTLDQTEFEYNGTEQRPNVTVTVDGKPVDADLTWPTASVSGGTYTVTATLKGNYTGTGSATYVIKVSPADQAAADAAGKAAEAKAATSEAAKKASEAADAATAAAAASKASPAAVSAAKDSVAAANEYLNKANEAKAAADAALESAKATGKQALIEAAEKAVNAAAADVTAAEQAVSAASAALEKAEDDAWKGVYDKKLPKLKIKKPSSKKTSITAKWTKLTKKQIKKSKASKIEIWVSTSKKFSRKTTVTKTTSKTKSSYTVKKLKKNKKYYVKVRPIKYVGGIKHVGKWSSVKTIKTKKK